MHVMSTNFGLVWLIGKKKLWSNFPQRNILTIHIQEEPYQAQVLLVVLLETQVVQFQIHIMTQIQVDKVAHLEMVQET